MPKHYALNANVFRGSIHFDNAKTGVVYFVNENNQPVSFTKAPFVTLTILDETNAPALKQSWIKKNNLFVGMIIKFTTNYTGDIAWEVKE